MTDQEIIDGIRKNDRAAEKYFYQQHKLKCTQYALKHFFWKPKHGGETMKCNEEDAEELYNDACVLFIHNLLRERIDQLEVKISTYLITSMRYAWMNKARKERKGNLESLESKESLVSKESLESPEKKELLRVNVRKAIQQLDEKCREMMTYRYILGWEDYEDIANATGKNNGDVVRNLISRCRKRFRELYMQVNNLSGLDKTVDYGIK